MICIVCPIGCMLEVHADSNNINVTGNKCPRGMDYAKEEILSPKRIVTATVQIEETGSVNDSVRRLPVKTKMPIPKEKISELLNDIYKTKISLPVKTGDIIISNWNGLNIDVVATRSLTSCE